MTTWIDASGGRERGVAGTITAWARVLFAPREFFTSAISTGDQAPGLTFAITVSLIAALPRVLADSGGSLDAKVLEGLLVLLLIAVFVTPVGLHLVAALETVGLLAVEPDRAGVSQTVQLIAYAIAPCAVTGVCAVLVATTEGVLATMGALIWVLATSYGAVLLVYGTAIVHETSIARATISALVPAVILFGYVFGARTAIMAIL
ncbi:YIP1 family protein [Halocatena halophila]|uniref:YIP1 family protein n=1 Tax=Halocatena halophila TaxID=2814576 RepID=UPI002ED2638C